MSLESNKALSNNIKSSIDHGRVEKARIRRSADGKDVVLDLPEETITREKLPSVTIITVTRNRKRFFPLAIDNWKRIYYPDNKLNWLIVDDSDDVKDGPIEQLKALKDSRVKYYYKAPIKQEDSSFTGHSVGYKRNLAMSMINTEYAVMMDDDDYLYNESVLARVCCCLYYGKECAYSDELGVYHVFHERSYILEQFNDVPEGTIMMTKRFWEKQKFGEGNGGEGRQLVSGLEMEMIRVPFMFNLIVLNHANNATGRNRCIRFKMTGALKQQSSLTAPINFYKLFPESFKKAIELLKS
jgi:glycosyltransferase involved in cell wall biosynthesis